ncbi:MAG: hypothetical protein QGI61_20610 [Alphaproteobacteria bacterium]|jgi:hypothetical protein|nr:hypothetical protein [Alphaproteobacteria bacterium]|tara:strand:+ start:67 stop:201 length:135 start_codon:yes stop_codon:yes gene_type:complete
MDLYTQEDMRRDKRMAILKYVSVTTAVIASFVALIWTGTYSSFQ